MFAAIVFAGVLFLIYNVAGVIWNLFLHPLHHIPGPKTWIAFPLLRRLSEVRGLLERDLRAFHATYGEAVRYGPAEVSFITAQAWKDIYGHGHQQFQKVLNSASNPKDIISANNADHTRHRRALAHAFSAKGLQAQEPVLIAYVDKLISRLHDVAESRLPVDMVKWYNLTTFDLIGDLAYGEPFGGLDSSQYHHWVSTIFQSVRALSFIKLKDVYPLVFWILVPWFPKGLQEAREKQLQHSTETVQKRLQSKVDRGHADFMQSMLRHRGEKDELTDEELEANANILIIAGSETTATLLSGLTFWLLRSPECLEKVVQEVRSTLETEDDITFNNVSSKLPYMLACIEEGLRMYPPVPTGLLRWTPSWPVEISGVQVAPHSNVCVNQYSAYLSPTNFHKPERFIPERWLPEAKTDPSSPFFDDQRNVLQPFSIGPRNCIGKNLAYAEMRVMLARVLWNFDLELAPESATWSEQKTYTLWHKPPLMCKLTKRNA
ncbi:cytochrome P450 [Aspergillus heteromorphus CBS 117.55]|uniref:Cytochrome P450 n=1 Tax=Aspergillus heteromorphus CBS 117.55 TaxID=1448321 RepID=A0A317VVR0_9EURO|nr:cytochrome P450 [Aspergillus heteromorphus CBS 117.55]PWY78383.1 cytochrome P450 [Aspergillus heteromorphus CBS 117.55]